MVWRGSRLAAGSWKMAWSLLLQSFPAEPRHSCWGKPSSRTMPSCTGTSPSKARSRVDLPHPDSPTTPTASPRPRCMVTPSTAFRANGFFKKPCCTGKVTLSPVVSSMLALPDKGRACRLLMVRCFGAGQTDGKPPCAARCASSTQAFPVHRGRSNGGNGGGRGSQEAWPQGLEAAP